MQPDNTPTPGAQPIPVFTYKEAEAQKAFLAFARLRNDIREDPALRDNPYFMALVDTAAARFRARFEVAL